MVFNYILTILYCIQLYFSYTAATSAPIHVFMGFFLPFLFKIFFPSHWLLSQIAIKETMDSHEREMNPIKTAIANQWTQTSRAGDRTSNIYNKRDKMALDRSPEFFR